ncbi:hypothetical protein AB0F88_44105 [Streptosporangium sp. NPDC023963]|uniref:single-stranded DNA-binding protein n=1 Tax=Streptosporangium sp. NPDC023963 TaxID=3155608 RepID=UPI00341D9200
MFSTGHLITGTGVHRTVFGHFGAAQHRRESFSTGRIEEDRMDRNEVILVGRLPEAAHIRSLQSGSRLGTWRLIVRRQHRGRGARVDTIPCASFELEVIEAVAGWQPDDIVEVTGSLRRRWWGSEGAKSSGYEVEVRSVRRLERKVTMVLTGDEGVPAPAPPRSVRSLMHAEQVDTGQVAEPRLNPVKPDITSSGPSLAPSGPEVTSVGGVDSSPARPSPAGPDLIGLDSVPISRPGLVPVGRGSAPVSPDLTSARPDLTSARPDLTSVGRDLASAEPDHLTLARPDLTPEGMPEPEPEPEPVPRAVKASISDRSQVPHPVTRAGAVSGAGR